jgi:hypothetical protein
MEEECEDLLEEEDQEEVSENDMLRIQQYLSILQHHLLGMEG